MAHQRTSRRVGLLLFLLSLTSPLAGLAQNQDAAATAARALFDNAQYADAATAFEQFLKDYPTSALVPEMQMRAGYAHFLNANYDQAIAFLGKILEPPAPNEIQELGNNLIAQAKAAKAAALPPDAPNRTAAFEDAIKQYGVYIQKYPQKEEVESAQYGRALCHFQIGKHKEAADDLRKNLQQFPRSATVLDSHYLLALALQTQANLAMADGKNDRATADPLYDEAEKLLKGIIDNNSDLALANDAAYQLGETRFLRAAFLEGDPKRDEYLQAALGAYRLVEPKEKMVALKQKRMEAAIEERRKALAARDQQRMQALQRAQERESAKLASLQNKPDQTISALGKVGEIFYQLGDYDATRVVYQQLARFAETEEDKQKTKYYLAMSYALQGVVDKALAAYEEFQGQYKGAPIAENLPLAIASMLAGAGKAEDSIAYFDQQAELYPNSRFRDLAAIQKASALVGLKRYDEALTTFQTYLKNNPKAPRNIAVQAELGMASVYRETGKFDEAIAGFRKVRDSYKEMPDFSRQAALMVGISELQKGDAQAAIKDLQEFVQQYPDTDMTGPAMFTLAQAQSAGGQADAAIETFKQVAAKYPKSEMAPQTFIQRAQLLASQQKAEEMIAVLREFMAGYPEDERVYVAAESIGQALTNLAKNDEAVQTYRDFAAKYAQSPDAPKALLAASELRRAQANAIGRYVALDDAQRAQWQQHLDESIKLTETILSTYPDSPTVALALQSLLTSQRLLLNARLKTPEQVEGYFKAFADKFDSSPGTRSKVIFTLASYVYEKDKPRALELMKQAFKPDILFAPADLDLYGGALVEGGDLDSAQKVYEKVGADFPIPAGVDPQQAAPEVQDAQAIMLYGTGRVQQERKQVAEAAKTFERLRTLYPWSPKILEANYGIAQGMAAEGKGDEAMSLLVQIIRATTATADLRANSMLLGGMIHKAKAEKATDPKEKEEMLEAAIGYFGKIATFYEGVPKAATEGLWEAGQLLEAKAGGIPDANKKTATLVQAARNYKELADKFPDSPLAEKAKGRLSALPPIPPSK